MQLPGRLRPTTLGDVLGTLYRGRATGVLQLVEASGVQAGRSHRLHLDAGLVRQVETQLAAPRLGDILRREGFILEDAARLLARRLLTDPNQRTGEILIEERLASPTQVAAALRHQLRVRLEALFALTDARLQFHVARPRRIEVTVAVPLSPHEFLHGRPRGRDQRAARASAGRASSPPEPHARRRRALSLLGLSDAADRQAVQRAFRSLAVRLHPDRHPDASPGEMVTLMRGFAELTAAYHELVA